jgi:hypothetical protein
MPEAKASPKVDAKASPKPAAKASPKADAKASPKKLYLCIFYQLCIFIPVRS